MKARTVELLYILLWSAEELLVPTYRDVNCSFESWAYRKGILRELQALSAQEFVEGLRGKASNAIYKLSERGRLVALGGRDPVAEWAREWDGVWRMVVFDLPQSQANARNRLRRFLKDSRFGYLQNSVWISPVPLPKVTKKLSAMAEDVEAIITLE